MAKLGQQDFSGGQIDISSNLAPTNTAGIMQNLDADIELGSAVSRLGTATRGAQLVAAMNILGLHQHVDTVTVANNKLFAGINASGAATSVIYDVVAGSTSVTGLTSNKKIRFLTFNGATLALNGVDAARSYTSAGWITTGGAFDLGNITSATVNLCEEFLDRVYTAGDTAQPTRLFYSGVSNATAVSWTVGQGNVDIRSKANDGKITALSKVPGYLLIFKERSMHRWNFSSAFPESLVQIGAMSQECVVKGGGLCAFYSNSNETGKGFYITNGDRPQCISQDNNRPIKKWVDAIGANSKTFTAAVSDVITSTGHGLSNGDTIFVSSSTTLPAGLSANTTYYVISAAANTFSVSVNNGGSAVNITDTGTGTHTYYHQPVVAGWATDRYFCWSVGDLVVDGETFTNVVLKYNRLLNQWTMRTYPAEFKVFAGEMVNGINTIIGGADDGTVYQMDKSGTYTDANTSSTQNFSWKLRQNHMTYGENKVKTFSEKIVVRGKNIQTARVSAIVDEEMTKPVSLIQNAVKKILAVFNITSTTKGTSLAVEVSGESSGAPCIIREIEVVKVGVEENFL